MAVTLQILHLASCLFLFCRLALEGDKRALADKLAAGSEQATIAERSADLAQRAEGAARREAARITREASQRAAAAESRSATLLEALEGIEDSGQWCSHCPPF